MNIFRTIFLEIFKLYQKFVNHYIKFEKKPHLIEHEKSKSQVQNKFFNLEPFRTHFRTLKQISNKRLNEL